MINVLVCKADGSQVIEQREVPEDYFSPSSEEENTPDAGE